ncbi:MAG: hemerythrin family protein [Rhodocyclales bacterium]|nr:hemerythrin family protein [Rhodocyclales bacterium]
MALLNWNRGYLTGNARIDSDHQHLFELINSFHYAFIQNRDRTDILRILNGLVQYAEEHFQREETMMADRGYPKLEAHQRIHADLFETIFQLQAKLEEASVKMEKETVDFLRHWLTDHIAEHDTEFARFLAEPA